MDGALATEPYALDAFTYELPRERIAQTPLEERDASRLLHVTPNAALADHVFTELPSLLREGDLLVANDTRVRAARLAGRRGDGGAAEVLLLERIEGASFAALVRPARRLHPGDVVTVGEGMRVTILGPAAGHPGARMVRVDAPGDVDDAVAGAGSTPLPPYIRAPLRDAERYQTTYAAGAAESAAAPTAGLHFTDRVRAELRERGVGWTAVRLHVGLGTFAPITEPDVRRHRMHREWCSVPGDAARAVALTRRRGGRVVAVGTTAVRTLESHARDDGTVRAASGSTALYITPGHRFRAVDGLLTNFHQPRSSLLVLLAAFTGEARWRSAYAHALAAGYRFLSFGDCMLCWRAQT